MRALGLLLIVGSMGFGFHALACSTESCGGTGCLGVIPGVDTSDCNYSTVLLLPTNDTRSNIVLLYKSYQPEKEMSDSELRDRGDSSPNWISHPPVCAQSETATKEFLAAVGDSGLPSSDADLLEKLRNSLAERCQTAPIAPKLEDHAEYLSQLKDAKLSPAAEPFVSYLRATHWMIQTAYAKAIPELEKSAKNGSGWLRETSFYLQGRARLLNSQKDWGGPFASDTHVAKPELELSRKAFDTYLKKFPTGRYRESSIGLRRRIAWLSGDYEALGELSSMALAGLIKRKEAMSTSLPLLLEIDRFLTLAESTALPKNPILATAKALYIARSTGDKKSTELAEVLTSLKSADLEEWKKYPGLQDFTIAAVLFAQKKYKEAAAYKQSPDGKSSWVKLSHRFVIARSLDALKQFDDAKPQWLAAIAEAIELTRSPLPPASLVAHYALNRLAAGKSTEILAEAPVAEHKEVVGEIVNRVLTEAELLKAGKDSQVKAENRELAGRTYLNWLLIGRRYGEFVKKVAELGLQKDFEDVTTAASTLATQGEDPKALLNAGFFMQSKHLAPADFQPCGEIKSLSHESLSYVNRKRTLPKKLESPYLMYQRALRGFEKGSKDELQAKILYHLVNCHSRTLVGGPGACFWGLPQEVDTPETRKKWYTRLKTEFPKTTWAKNQGYYW